MAAQEEMSKWVSTGPGPLLLPGRTVYDDAQPEQQKDSLLFQVLADDLGTFELLCYRFIGWNVAKSIGSRY